MLSGEGSLDFLLTMWFPALSQQKPAQPPGSSGHNAFSSTSVERRVRALGQRKIFRADLAPHLVGLELESDLLAFGQPGKTGAFNGADVNEHIVAAVVRLDKSEALLPIEPLHSTCRHLLLQSAHAHPARQSRE